MMHKNIFMYSLSILISCTIGQTVHAQKTSSNKPNVVVMLADNMGFGDLGVYGSGGAMRGMPTPRIDQLANEGMRLTQFFVEAGCTPTRSGLLTGRYSPRMGLGSIIINGTPSTLQADEMTMAELFKSKGYATGMTGKWHLGEELQSVPTSQGFDEYKVGIIQTTDGTLYEESMKRAGMPQPAIDAAIPWIWESQKGTKELKKVRPYDLEYRRQIESDIADASVDFIKRKTAAKEPFFLYIGWSHVHYPGLPNKEFEGKSSQGQFGDMVMELDHRTGQVLDALKAAGVDDNTIVIWLSDNGPVHMQTPGMSDFMGSSAGPFLGEVGDVSEGSLRVPAMIKWPNHIKPGVTNEMVSVHDFFPTLASIIGADVPKDRPIDGVDYSKFFTGKTTTAPRESVINFLGNEIAAVRWKNYRFYPKSIIPSSGNPAMHGVGANRAENLGYPAVFDIERDQREQWNVAGTRAWTIAAYLKIVMQYQATLKEHPNPPAFNMVEFKK